MNRAIPRAADIGVQAQAQRLMPGKLILVLNFQRVIISRKAGWLIIGTLRNPQVFLRTSQEVYARSKVFLGKLRSKADGSDLARLSTSALSW